MFGTLKDAQQLNTSGVGLGLFICKQLVEQFDGLIAVKSKANVGTKFTFFFRLEEPEEHSEDLQLTEMKRVIQPLER